MTVAQKVCGELINEHSTIDTEISDMGLNFDDALMNFKQFLLSNKFSDEIVWTSPENALLADNEGIYIKSRPKQYNDSHVRELFNAAIAQSRGILLAALCEMNQKTVCYAWVPADDFEAERNLMSKGIKMSVPTDRRLRAIPVRNSLKWVYLSLKYRTAQKAKKELFK